MERYGLRLLNTLRSRRNGEDTVEGDGDGSNEGRDVPKPKLHRYVFKNTSVGCVFERDLRGWLIVLRVWWRGLREG